MSLDTKLLKSEAERLESEGRKLLDLAKKIWDIITEYEPAKSSKADKPTPATSGGKRKRAPRAAKVEIMNEMRSAFDSLYRFCRRVELEAALKEKYPNRVYDIKFTRNLLNYLREMRDSGELVLIQIDTNNSVWGLKEWCSPPYLTVGDIKDMFKPKNS